MGFIYKITNLVSKKCYIGETVQSTPEKRWKAHRSFSKTQNGCKALSSAIKKYGLEKFKFEVLIICFDEDRFIYEKEYIKKYNSLVPNGYNILEGGQKGVLGFKHSEETKKKIALKSKECGMRPEIKEKRRLVALELHRRIKAGEVVRKTDKWYKALKEGRIGNKGGNITIETKKKISESLKLYYKNNNSKVIKNKEKWHQMLKSQKGKKLKDNHKNNISSSLTNYYNKSYENFYNNNDGTINKKSRTTPVAQYSIDNKLIKVFPSVAEAARSIKINPPHMSKIIRRENNKYKDRIWKYADEKDLKTLKDIVNVEK
jgi:group I intron endonuclease